MTTNMRSGTIIPIKIKVKQPFVSKDVYPVTKLPAPPDKEQILRFAQPSYTSRGTTIQQPTLSESNMQIILSQMSSLSTVTPSDVNVDKVVNDSALVKIYKPDQLKAAYIANIDISRLLPDSATPYTLNELHDIQQHLDINRDTYNNMRINILNIAKLYHTSPNVDLSEENKGILTEQPTDAVVRDVQALPQAQIKQFVPLNTRVSI